MTMRSPSTTQQTTEPEPTRRPIDTRFTDQPWYAESRQRDPDASTGKIDRERRSTPRSGDQASRDSPPATYAIAPAIPKKTNGKYDRICGSEGRPEERQNDAGSARPRTPDEVRFAPRSR